LTVRIESRTVFKRFGRSLDGFLHRAAGCQRPLAEMQQAGISLIFTANADGEPEIVLQ
jgi:hypothetical protein